MNLINKRLLAQRILSFEFPIGEKQIEIRRLVDNWQKALKDNDLEKTKEKSVQGKFLETFFERILGYSDMTEGQDEWTLIQHPRIENDSMEPDGSLGWFTKDQKITRAVIELKDAKTLLDKKQIGRVGKYTPVEQAYLYSTKYNGCNWIIVSNFKEIRLYNKQTNQEYYEKFEVLDFNDETEFKRFYFLLCKDNLISKDKESVIDRLVRDTTVEEQDITKKFYVEFKKIRMSLLDHLISNNLQIGKPILLEKTQKLLDRFIFTLVCEDTSDLLPLNIVKNTYERAIASLSPSDERVWTEFKGLFLAIDKGNNRVKPPINAYNGGLFAFDDVLDNLVIKDDIWQELMNLAEYNFETDLNVNILGHIFEQSISDLELIKESIFLAMENGGNLLLEDGDKIKIGTKEKMVEKVGKRKKDGIFYTPEYITRYIVENTVGRYLEENPDKLDTIKILDPACGSGAFLNQAHSFLFKEHRNRYEARINEKIENKETVMLFDYKPAGSDREILLNNLYGVDLNQESVDITKLALWLKTARKNQPLQSLDKNIKAGNSLIDDSNIAGINAFDWKTQFKDIFDNGGFDIVIGNPPYVNSKLIPKIERDYYWNKYEKYLQMDLDLYEIFLIKSILELVKPGGFIGFITPNSYYSGKAFELFRELIIKETEIINIVDFSYRFFPFDDVNTETSIIILRKQKSEVDKPLVNIVSKNDVGIIPLSEHEKHIAQIPLIKGNNTFIINISEIAKKVVNNISGINFDDYFLISNPSSLDRKSRTPTTKLTKYDKCIFFDSDLNNDNELLNIVKPALEGNNILRYHLHGEKKYTNMISRNGEGISKKTLEYMGRPKLVSQRITGQAKWRVVATIDKEGYITMPSVNIILSKNDNSENLTSLLAIINSRFYNYLYKQIYGESNTNITSQVFRTIPIPSGFSKVELVDLVNQIVVATNEEAYLLSSILSFLKESYQIELSKTAEDFLSLGWNQLNDQIDKAKDKEDLFEWFKQKKLELEKINLKVKSIEKDIDKEVYKLYGLTDEEIKIVEGSVGL